MKAPSLRPQTSVSASFEVRERRELILEYHVNICFLKRRLQFISCIVDVYGKKYIASLNALALNLNSN